MKVALPLNFCTQPEHVSALLVGAASRCWCTMSCGEATTRADRETKATRARADFIVERDGLGWFEVAAISDDHFWFNPLCLYIPVVSRICFHRDARLILVSELPFLSYVQYPLPVDPISQGPEAGCTSATILYYSKASRIWHRDGVRSSRWSNSFDTWRRHLGRHRHNLRLTRASY